MALVLVKVKPFGLATPNLDNHPPFPHGFAERYPPLCAAHSFLLYLTKHWDKFR